MNNTSNTTTDNPNKVVLPGGITVQRIARTVGGRTYYSKAWYMRAQVNGRRSWFKLGADLKKAKAKACEIANSLGAGGITAQLGFEQGKVKQPKTTVATLGELIDQIELSTGVFDMAKASTIHGYLLSMKLVVREVTEWKLGRKLEPTEILTLPSTILTPAIVRDFRNLRVQGVPEGPGLRSAKLTANGHLRAAQAVLAPSIMDHLRDKGMSIPDFTPFRSSPLFKKLRTIYVLLPDETIISHGDEEARDVCLAGRGPRIMALGGHIHRPVGFWGRLHETITLNPGRGDNMECPNHIVIDMTKHMMTHHSGTVLGVVRTEHSFAH